MIIIIITSIIYALIKGLALINKVYLARCSSFYGITKSNSLPIQKLKYILISNARPMAFVFSENECLGLHKKKHYYNLIIPIANGPIISTFLEIAIVTLLSMN